MNELNEPSSALDKKPTPEFPEVQGRTSVFAFFLGMAIILASIALGKSYTFAFAFLIISVFFTFRWRMAPRPWIFLVSTVASTPITTSFRYQVTCIVVFAVWFTIFDPRYLFKLPKWIYLVFFLALYAFVFSSVNWIGVDFPINILR
ncbi:MAG TPA: hypothetical protein VEF33_09225, partial [Syntrophales bacterium]|nr:hypothetical protein [Syntrophales bacterium]